MQNNLQTESVESNQITTDQYYIEVIQGLRFEFGANWLLFLSLLNDERISQAEASLLKMLCMSDLSGQRFLDVGSGSGLFSLAARRLGAKVFSFDYDPKSLACTAELKRRYFDDDPAWTVEAGSVLDKEYLERLGTFDIVYSWGVLHHTGAMWSALDNIAPLVKDGGSLFIALYNDQGWPSNFWKKIKKAYCMSPKPIKSLIAVLALLRLWGPTTIRDLLKGQPGASWKKRNRGMSAWRDVVDWVGGYPFEVAKPEMVFDFCRDKGFHLEKLKTCAGGHGCNEYVFLKGT
jgi:2-polyprenyl-6-hydroxyphenyl methylase/3-demethylubiquinone-9 3-methyltransferase